MVIQSKINIEGQPNFDCENPYDGPNVEDKKCFKNLTSRSSFGKQLCLVHPKVLRWITVAQAKLTATVVDNGYCDLSRYSTTCPEFTDEVDVSPIEFNFSEKKPSIILQKIVTQNSLNQQEINDPERIISRQELNASPKIDVTNAQKSIKDEQVTQSLAPEIRRQIFDHKDGTTIGQALDYWWAEKTKLKEKEETLYTCRVEVIAKIRSLHELPSVKQAKNLCEWCSRQRRSRIRPFAMFVAEKAFRTCKECKMRFYSRYGCFTVASNQWIELPRIFDEGIDVVSAYRKLIELNSCSNYIKRDMNFNRNIEFDRDKLYKIDGFR
uniref:Uncharacterized protein n=1 Tax=Romanomermis culicivorax TaxID=13658 RepID=A0A915HS46_ROMCU